MPFTKNNFLHQNVQAHNLKVRNPKKKMPKVKFRTNNLYMVKFPTTARS